MREKTFHSGSKNSFGGLTMFPVDISTSHRQVAHTPIWPTSYLTRFLSQWRIWDGAEMFVFQQQAKARAVWPSCKHMHSLVRLREIAALRSISPEILKMMRPDCPLHASTASKPWNECGWLPLVRDPLHLKLSFLIVLQVKKYNWRSLCIISIAGEECKSISVIEMASLHQHVTKNTEIIFHLSC